MNPAPTLLQLFSLVLLLSCASAPEKLEREAQALGFSKIRLPGIDQDHIAFENRRISRQKKLHIYLEGDGTPWLSRNRIANDPTPRNPVMLRLMALDRSAALYLGRPCYIGLSNTAPCNPRIWTDQRYSSAVVDSMASALRSYLATHHYSELVFVGHSGGGTLAILLATEFPETTGIVSLAGNVDTEKWTAFHGFSPLEGSQNPANLPPLLTSVKEMHFVGTNDKNILPEFVLSRKISHPNIAVTILEGFDHTCCWDKIWPSILKQIGNVKQADQK